MLFEPGDECNLLRQQLLSGHVVMHPLHKRDRRRANESLIASNDYRIFPRRSLNFFDGIHELPLKQSL